MSDQPALLEATPHGDVTVVRFTHRTVLDPDAIDAVGARLLALVTQEDRRKLVLDFTRVESLTSAMLAKLVSLYRAIEAQHGQLVFCGVGPFLQTIFTLCHIPQTIPIYPDEAEAVRVLSA
jgi:anti-sigma B factor antagonist